MRELILSRGMSKERAVNVLNTLDDGRPWYSKLDYITALAALSSAFPREMDKRTYVQSKSMGHIIWCAAAPEKVAWQWNALIVRRALPREFVDLLASGTASNEALHSEMNRWYRNQPEVHSK